MICLDMDGTLLNSNNIILESSKTILKRLKELGQVIVIITGRSIECALKYLSNDFADYLLCDDGTIWYSLKDNKIIKKDIINIDSLIKVIDEYKNIITSVSIAAPKFISFNELEQAISFLKLNNQVVHCAIHLKNYNDCVELVPILKQKYPRLEFLVMQDSFRDRKWITVLPKGNNKGNNLKKLREFLNVDENNVITFGDGLNDIDMLSNSKISVAMKNALPNVKKAANYITDSNDDDGIYKFLNGYFFNNKI